MRTTLLVKGGIELTVWVMPFLIVSFLLVWITVSSIRKTSKLASLTDGRDEISENVEEHPFTLNPIIWIILIASIFMGIVIVYYAASIG